MKRLVPSAVLVSMLLAASSALALTDEQKQNLKSLDYYKTQVDLKNRPFRDGQADSDVSSALYGYETKLKTVKERLDKIPAADRKDPMYESYAAWANEFESTLKRWQGERATNAQNLKNKAQAEETYKNETREVADGLGFVKQLRGTYSYSLDAKEMLAKWKAAEKLTAYAAKCDKEFAPVDATSYYGKDKAENCKNAAEWKTLVVPFLEKRSGENVQKLGADLEGVARRISNGETTYDGALKRLRSPDEYIATLRGPYEALFQAMGKSLPSDFFAPITNAGKGYAAAIAASQAKVSYKPGKFADATVTNAVKAALTAKNVKVLKVSQTFGDWDIRKTDYGLPTHRIRDSIVLGQVSGETSCRLIELTSKQDYQGGGRYTTNTVVDLPKEPAFKVASCK